MPATPTGRGYGQKTGPFFRKYLPLTAWLIGVFHSIFAECSTNQTDGMTGQISLTSSLPATEIIQSYSVITTHSSQQAFSLIGYNWVMMHQ
jgi:UDP-N-acetylmuramyl pentapeptide phosphotransferase/UDP-N-acetylglucosamine-1-phosphate transferase